MTTFAEGKARNLALDSAGPFGYGHGSTNEYRAVNLGNTLRFEETVRLTISFDLEMTVAKANPTLQVYNSNNKGPMVFSAVNALAGETHAAGETIEKRCAVTVNWSPRSNANTPTNFIEFYSTYNTGNYFTISNLMVELGEVAHPWRAAPEDSGAVSDMIIATDSCTLAVAVDVQKVETFYCQIASTASAPAKPTTASPTGWQATEFAFDASKAVWACQKTTLTDGTFYWGEVSKSSAYEGAVASKNAADAAQRTANGANAREQEIYRSAASGTSSMSGTTTWVTDSTGGQGKWTCARPPYSSAYPVLFVATQRQTVAQQAAGSECTCTTPWVDDSAAVAGNYIFDTGGNDVWIHSEGHGPDGSGEATTNTYGWRIGSVFELVRAGVSAFKLWVEDNVTKVRVGREDGPRTVIQDGGTDFYGASDGSAHLAHIGYESGYNASGGSASAPYYTFGTRAAGDIGNYSLIEGVGNLAKRYASHAEGIGTIAGSRCQHVEGEYNVEDSSNVYAHIIGDGYSSQPHNLYQVPKKGVIRYEPVDPVTGYDSQDNPTYSAVGYRASNRDTGTMVDLQVGAGGFNHGVYSPTHSMWIVDLNEDGDRVRLGGYTPFKVVSCTTSAQTIAASSSFGCNATPSPGTGYSFVGVLGFTSNHNQSLTVMSCNRTAEGQVHFAGRNATTTKFTDATFTAYCLCAPTATVY